MNGKPGVPQPNHETPKTQPAKSTNQTNKSQLGQEPFPPELREALKRLAAAEKTIEKQKRRIRNLENVLDVVKEELSEARQRARRAGEYHGGEGCLQDNHGHDSERWLSLVESLAFTLECEVKRSSGCGAGIASTKENLAEQRI